MFLFGVFFVFALVMMTTSMVVATVVLAWQTSKLRRANLLSCLAVVVDRELPLAGEVGPIVDALLKRSPQRARKLIGLLESGKSLSESLREVRLISDRQAVALQAAEASGNLSAALRHEADRMTRGRFLTSTGSSSPTLSVVYLFAVPCTALLIVLFLCYWIVPKYKAIFAGFGSALPQVFVILINAVDLLVNYFYLFFAIAILVSVFSFMSLSYFRNRFGFGWSNRRFASSICRAIAYAAKADRPLPELFTSDRPFSPLPPKLMARIAEQISQGKDPWDALHRRRILTGREAIACRTAQIVGNLPETLFELADVIDDNRARRRLACLEFVQPMLVVAVGLLVFFINVGFFMPLVKLLNDLS
ncbi:type II secretion system F family protein [Stratiformator vulcanicus]|uniref:Type IV pilin biogenesis protein n=1 Tax=Stratiformator vulcanicus TaxID=2527980 RepID=A0A517QX50_9PLAN|nr:type II secretion system F family protein [Stratiformator vulcanicus]QDT36174.1 type IV pilin biogenesis protein [Stratiformator vulcanicus]